MRQKLIAANPFVFLKSKNLRMLEIKLVLENRPKQDDAPTPQGLD